MHAVLDRLEPHEAASVNDLDARPRRLDDERGDLLAHLAVHDGIRRSRHHDEQFGARAVRAPQLLAVEDEILAVGRQLGVRVHVRRVGTGVHFREGERADRALGEPRKILRLLRVVAEQFERLRQSYGLMGRQKRRERSVLRRHQRHRPHVTRIREPEAAVLLGDLDPEGAHLAKLLDVFLGNLARAIDHVRIDPLEELAKRVEKRPGAFLFLGVVGRMRMNQVEPKTAEKHLAHEARTRPLALARRLGDVSCLALRSVRSRLL